MASRRLNSELSNIAKNPTLPFTVQLQANDIYTWKVRMVGPAETPYEGGIFYITLTFPTDYPFKPPKVKFDTQIYHPNVNSDGSICLEMLKESWNPALNAQNVLQAILSLLTVPNPDDPLVPEIANLYKTDKAAFEQTAREWTKKYAVEREQ